MKRILVTQPLPNIGTFFSPAPEQLHHLQNVRRVREGERLEVLDGVGGLAIGVVHWIENHVEIQVIERPNANRESPLKICLALAIPSHRKTLDHLLPALVQLGVWRFHLIQTQFSGRLKGSKNKFLQRMTKIAHESLKQCGRLTGPEIHFAHGYEDTCSSMERDLEMNLIFHPAESETDASNVAADPAEGLLPWAGPPPNGLGLLIGPEGGFSANEVDFARSCGFWVSHLGPRVLRLETAVVGTCFWAQALFGDLSSGVNGR